MSLRFVRSPIPVRGLCALCGVLALALFAGCDSSDPEQVETQVLTISMNANGAMAETFDVWDMIIDNDGDLQPDDGETYLWCENSVQNLAPITVPWTFSVQIDMIPADTTIKGLISSANAFDVFYNVANYDTLIGLDTQNQRPPITEGGNTYLFREPRKLPAVNQDVFFATFNPLAFSRGNPFAATCPGGQSFSRCGRCSQTNSGLPRIDGIDIGGEVQCSAGFASRCEIPWTITINKGDTLVFQSRIADDSQIGVGLREVLRQNPNSLSATVEVDGRRVTLRGVANGPALSFSFTSR